MKVFHNKMLSAFISIKERTAAIACSGAPEVLIMKTWTKRIIGISCAAVLAFGAISLSCRKTPVNGSADTAFAETRATSPIPADSLKMIQAMQDAFRSISDTLLPSVVEIENGAVESARRFTVFLFRFAESGRRKREAI